MLGISFVELSIIIIIAIILIPTKEIPKLIKFSLKTYKNQVKAIKASIKASNTALKGVKEEASVGTRTTLDVLDAEQESLQESIELIIVKNNILSTKYELLEKMGSLSPSTLKLNTSNRL